MLAASPLLRRTGVAVYPLAALALLMVPLGADAEQGHHAGALLTASVLLFFGAVIIAIYAMDAQRPLGLAWSLHACGVLTVAVLWAALEGSAAGELTVAVVISGAALAVLNRGRMLRKTLQPAWQSQPPRYLQQAPVRFLDGDQWTDAITHDLSERGCFVTDRVFEAGQELDLELRLPGYAPLRCRGAIRWSSLGSGHYPAGSGVEFLNLGPHERRLVAELVDAARFDNAARGVISPRGD